MFVCTEIVGTVAEPLVWTVFRARFANGMVSESSAESERRIRSSRELGYGDFCFFFFPSPPDRGLVELDVFAPRTFFVASELRGRALSG